MAPVDPLLAASLRAGSQSGDPPERVVTASIRGAGDAALESQTPAPQREALARLSEGHGAVLLLRVIGTIALVLAACVFAVVFMYAFELRRSPWMRLMLIALDAFYAVAGVLLWVCAEATRRGLDRAPLLSYAMLWTLLVVFVVSAGGNLFALSQVDSIQLLFGVAIDVGLATLVAFALAKYMALMEAVRGR